ncbi:MAG: class I SAM-dependent methyltransferase [Pseudomonadota bacterium]
MVSPDFCRKVKENVAANFDQSLEAYQAFEDKHHFFADMSAVLAEWIQVPPGASVLDVGCGNGISAEVLNARFGCSVLGVDLSPNMVADGQRRLSGADGVRLVVGDGDRLIEVAGRERFDYVLYNASIFIFPDVENTIREAAGCLKTGGCVAFSFYPTISGPTGEDLLETAFRRLGEPLPRARVITGYTAACTAIETHCGPVAHHTWEQPLEISFLKDFFSIPAQSASLFPGQDYGVRRKKVALLFEAVAEMEGRGSVVWRMARSIKDL